jgi:hypothetical protein
MRKWNILAAAAVSVALIASPAMARGGHGHMGGGMHMGHGGGFGGGFHHGGIGFGAGLVAGTALGYGYYGGYGPDYDDGYDDGNLVSGVDNSGYCAQRYRSYDPASGTFLGYDGQRHPCS